MSGVKTQTWAFRAILVILNIGGIIWIHHSLTWTPKPRLRVLSVLPMADVDSTDRFSLTFDEPLRLAGMVGSSLADPPFVVQPAAPGEWVWAAPERVEYRLSQPLPPGRRFKLRPSPTLERLTGRTLVGQSEFTFETKPLRLLSCRLVNTDRSHVNAELCFNQPVEPAELLRHLSAVEVAARGGARGHKLEAQCLTQSPAERLMLHIVRPGSNRLSVDLDGGLAGRGGEIPLGSKVTNELAADALFALVQADVETPGLDSATSVRLEATRGLKTGQASPTVKLEPAVKDLSVQVESNCVLLHGPFAPGQRYSATVSGNLLSDSDLPLGADATLSFEVPDRRPEVNIPLSAGILSPGGNLTLDLKAANVAGVRLRAARVHENNLAACLHDGDKKQTSRELPEKKISLQLERNQIGSLALDLREMVGGRRGIYYIEASATDVNWVTDEAVVAVTDLAITSKSERDGLYAWVTSLVSGRPVQGAEVKAITFNGQAVGTATTDVWGIARVPVPTGHPDGPAWVVTASLGEDVSFLRLGERTVMADGVDYSGRDVPKTYDVMLYAERGVYRPGDAIHLTGIARDAKGGVPPAMPLVVRVSRPDGREVADLPASPDPGQQGMFQVDFSTAADCQTGPYGFSVALPGDQEVLGAGKALVEEFVPIRLEVKAELVEKAAETQPAGGSPLLRGGKVAAQVKARYLFDQPGAGLAVKATGRLTRTAFRSKRFPEFTFDEPPGAKSEEAKAATGTLDGQGMAVLELLDPASLPTGFWQGEWAITVSETGGRSVSANVASPFDTAERHVGLRVAGGRLVRVGSPVGVEWVQVTPADEPAKPGTMAYVLQRVEEDVSLEDVRRRLVWKTVERVSGVAEGEIDGPMLDGGQGRFDVVCPVPGRYRLRVTDCTSGLVVQMELHASDEREAARMLATGEPERLDVVLDRDKYAPGVVANVLVRSPFPGTMLLTFEAATVVDQRVIELPGDSVEVAWPVDERLRGGAFVTATVVRAVDPKKDQWLPHRAYGAARLAVDWSQRELPVTIAVSPSDASPALGGSNGETTPRFALGASNGEPSVAHEAPCKARPGETVKVKVQTQSPTDPKMPPMVHIWAVDEGILATTAYETPRPGEHFFAHCKASVTTADVFDDLLPDYTRPASMMRIGGDGGADEEARRHTPIPSKHRAAAVVWSKVVATGPDGSVTIEMKMPDLNGEMRVMAVVVEGDMYGSARQAMTLASPLLVELSAPRFAAPGDQFAMPAKMFNGTDSAMRVTMDVRASGPVEVRVKEPAGEIEVGPGAPVIVWLEGKTAGLGQCEVVVKAIGSKGGGAMTGVAEAMFPVRPAGPLHSETKLLRVKAGEPLRIDPPTAFVAGTVRQTVSVSGSPTVHLQAALEDLIEYPYGCVEQTTSRLWALLYAPELLAGGEGGSTPRFALGASSGQTPATTSAPSEDSARVQAVREMIEAGLTRLWSMQTTSGGLSYWPGNTEPTLWGSAYAGEFIAQARRVGYKPEPRLVAELTNYLDASLSASGEEGPDDDLRAQLCYVLSALDKPPLGWMARLSEHAGDLDMAGRAHLAGAWVAAGRKDRAAAVLTEDTLAGETATTNGGRLTSQVRAEAVLLNVLLDLDTSHPWIPALVGRLEKARKAGRWGSTLENATALAAMARYQTTATTRGRFEGTVSAGGLSRTFNQSAATVLQAAGDGKAFEIQSTGEGDLFVSVSTEGLLRENAALDYDRGLKVTRKWTDRAGKPVDPAKLKIGDLVQVETTLAAPGLGEDESVENVAIVDALPGGLEVENPRLATSAAEGEAASAEPDRVEFRDDRVVLFASAGEKEQVFRYALRVMSEGAFEWPAVQASCMYDAGYASAHGGATKVTVSR